MCIFAFPVFFSSDSRRCCVSPYVITFTFTLGYLTTYEQKSNKPEQYQIAIKTRDSDVCAIFLKFYISAIVFDLFCVAFGIVCCPFQDRLVRIFLSPSTSLPIFGCRMAVCLPCDIAGRTSTMTRSNGYLCCRCVLLSNAKAFRFTNQTRANQYSPIACITLELILVSSVRFASLVTRLVNMRTFSGADPTITITFTREYARVLRSRNAHTHTIWCVVLPVSWYKLHSFTHSARNEPTPFNGHCFGVAVSC